jgi:hypothetical protein
MVLSNRLAAAAVAAMIYVGAVVNDEGEPQPENVWARPQTVIEMSDEALARTNTGERLAWASAAARGGAHIAELLRDWGVHHAPWYAANTRETLRDETWPKWRIHNAARRREGLAQSSSLPRWAITASFADLFSPELAGEELTAKIDEWRDNHLSTSDLLRIRYANDVARAEHRTPVEIPLHGRRYLEPGVASLIIKGIIEEWAPRRLDKPFVVAISEPGTKVFVLDEALMTEVGISINVSKVLPDVLMFDAGAKPPTFWIVEAVASDGEINEERKAKLLDWANDQYINPSQCKFLTAFTSRNSAPARKRLKDIAVGTFCWFLDEPDRELAWTELDSGD